MTIGVVYTCSVLKITGVMLPKSLVFISKRKLESDWPFMRHKILLVNTKHPCACLCNAMLSGFSQDLFTRVGCKIVLFGNIHQ